MKPRRLSAMFLILALALAPLHALASTFDLSSLTDDELITLQTDLTAELSARGLTLSTSDAAVPVPYDPLVWIPKSGSKYHSKSTCSNMKSPKSVTLTEAKRLGYIPCSKCNPPR